MGCGEAQRREPCRIEWLGDIDSTNAEALRRAQAGERGPLWLIARRQLTGRGRRGRVWVSEPGNLYASLLFAPQCAAAVAGQVAFVTGLALHDSICRLAPEMRSRLALKWPNDLLFDSAKVAGILLESAGSDGLDLMIVGCGVNCATHPADTPYAATDFASAGIVLKPDVLAAMLAEAFSARLEQWAAGANFTAIRAAWLERAHGIGKDIIVRLGERELVGVFEDLGSDGRLILRLPTGAHRDILAGDIYFPRPDRPTNG